VYETIIKICIHPLNNAYGKNFTPRILISRGNILRTSFDIVNLHNLSENHILITKYKKT
jgi:hypothetical protein